MGVITADLTCFSNIFPVFLDNAGQKGIIGTSI